MLLGQFDLVESAAPRGVPQIEVTFDIDANGIVHVAAKDLGTGKEQSIKITASSGLSEDEIKQMVKDAEAHAAEDKKHKETVEARNQLDSPSIRQKITQGVRKRLGCRRKENIENALKKARETLEGQDAQAMRTAAVEQLSQSSHKLAEAMYAKASRQQPGQEASGDAKEQPTSDGKKKKDDVVDADFEEVKD